jgi:hypothetical protein
LQSGHGQPITLVVDDTALGIEKRIAAFPMAALSAATGESRAKRLGGPARAQRVRIAFVSPGKSRFSLSVWEYRAALDEKGDETDWEI